MSHLDEKTIEAQLVAVVKSKSKNDKLAWMRKYNKLQTYARELKPLEDKALEIFKEKQPILDKISALRVEMIKECVHPREALIHNGNHIVCKFCDARLSIPATVHVADNEIDDNFELEAIENV